MLTFEDRIALHSALGSIDFNDSLIWSNDAIVAKLKTAADALGSLKESARIERHGDGEQMPFGGEVMCEEVFAHLLAREWTLQLRVRGDVAIDVRRSDLNNNSFGSEYWLLRNSNAKFLSATLTARTSPEAPRFAIVTKPKYYANVCDLLGDEYKNAPTIVSRTTVTTIFKNAPGYIIVSGPINDEAELEDLSSERAIFPPSLDGFSTERIKWADPKRTNDAIPSAMLTAKLVSRNRLKAKS